MAARKQKGDWVSTQLLLDRAPFLLSANEKRHVS